MDRYGISLENYLLLLLEQKGCCKICKKHRTEFNVELAVDHDHETGRIRGLLCFKCNVGLGYFHHDADIIRAAIDYTEDR